LVHCVISPIDKEAYALKKERWNSGWEMAILPHFEHLQCWNWLWVGKKKPNTPNPEEKHA